MTVSTQSNVVRYQGNGSTTVFAFAFEIPEASDAFVIYTDADGANTTLDSSVYTIAGLAIPTGGTVTYPLSGSPIASGTKLTILRILPLTQEIDIVNQSGFYPEVLEEGLDRLEFQIQQLNEENQRAITLNRTDTSTTTELPPQVVRAGKVLGFDSEGNPTAVSTLPTNIVSAAMIPVVEAATLQMAADLLGVVRELSVTQFGAVGDGTTDDTQAFIDTIAALSSVGGLIRIPAGKYKLTAKLTITLSSSLKSVNIVGDGQISTTLYWPTATGGIEVIYNSGLNSFRLEDLSMTCGVADAGTALLLHQNHPLHDFAPTVITNVALYGDDVDSNGFPALFNWSVGIKVEGVSLIDFDAINVLGRLDTLGCTGIELSGNLSVSPFMTGIIYNITNSVFLWTNTGILHGQEIQGVVVDRCQFTNGITGITTTPLASGGTLFDITNSQFNTYGNNIWFQTRMGDVYISNNLIYVPQQVAGVGRAGIILGDCLKYTIIGNQISGPADPTLSIAIISNGNWGIIANNFIETVEKCIWLTSGLGGNIVSNNYLQSASNCMIIEGVHTTITGNILIGDTATSTGIWIKSTSGFNTISANDVEGHLVGILIEGAATMISGNVVNGCNHAVSGTGIWYTGSSASNNQQSNVLLNNTINITDTGTGNTKGGGST